MFGIFVKSCSLRHIQVSNDVCIVLSICKPLFISYLNIIMVTNYCLLLAVFQNYQYYVLIPELPILPYYMDWIVVNFDTSEAALASLMSELPDLDPHNLSTLWSIIYTHTFHGRTSEAAKLLEFVNLDNSVVLADQLKLMSELMRKKPVFSPTTSSTSDFGTAWTEWHEECENRVSNRAFSGSQQLTLLGKVSV